MRFVFFFIPFILVLFVRCEKGYMAVSNELTDGFCIQINDDHHESYHHNIETLQPDPYDRWNKEWFYLLKSHEKKSFTLYYNRFDIIPNGQYNAYFRFPGLSYQVKNKEDLADENGRIWLGEVDVKKPVSFN